MIHALIVCLIVSTNEAKHRRLFDECLLEKDTIIVLVTKLRISFGYFGMQVLMPCFRERELS